MGLENLQPLSGMVGFILKLPVHMMKIKPSLRMVDSKSMVVDLNQETDGSGK